MKSVPIERIAALQERGALLLVDDPYPIRPAARWGHGKPPHPFLDQLFATNRDSYTPFLKDIVSMRDCFSAIPFDAPEDSPEPRWNQPWLPILDGMSIYTALAVHAPKRFIEVGSGNSTKFAAKAISDHKLSTQIFSIDPQPRSEVDGLCHRALRFSLETLDLSFFNQVGEGDVVFVDCSHRALQNSDVTVFFLEVLPALPAGCYVGIHDICLPMDYPPGWESRYYSEQYLLACSLLFGSGAFEILLPSYYVSTTPDLSQALSPLQELPNLNGRPPVGSIFWMRKK
ncbi:class I SAM-dependent methyltransferase [Desulfovibrio mangrovi]|uniref:class I SAM-dependent methyltransferase n=1 Tax=Desulfovibrio mangrovi TaxID=2976983 RepID=UPI0022477811|nr:class I SAM-dependent methyltransferase [Desulfovibrio mangrovi]UZP66898.1 class I SAM-dependent methyltransferase [Desulfovibrio mangrovi]